MAVFIETAKKRYEVKAICTSAGEANAICSLNPELAVIAEDWKSNLIFIAEIVEFGKA